jgi:hypothetical protein
MIQNLIDQKGCSINEHHFCFNELIMFDILAQRI